MSVREKKREIPTYELWSEYRSALMGFSILTIIFCHFSKDFINLHKVRPVWLLFIYNYFRSGGVDVFLFLSGLGCYYYFKRKNGKVNLKTYYVKRLSRVLIEYLLIAVPGVLIRRLLVQDLGFWMVVKDLTFINFFRIGDTWYWYIFMICVCYLLFPLLYRFVDTADTAWKEFLRLAGLCAVVTAACYLMSIYMEGLYLNINGAILRFFPWIFGTFVGKRSYEKQPLNWMNAVGIIPCLCFFSFASGRSVLVMRYMMAVNSLLFCFLLCFFFYCVRGFRWHPIQSFFEFTGKYTLELYLTHVTVRAIMTWYGHRPGTKASFAVMLTLSLILSVVLHVVTEKILRKVQPSGV